MSKQVNEVQNKYDNATEKYMNDLEKKNAQIAVLKSKDEIAIEMVYWH